MHAAWTATTTRTITTTPRPPASPSSPSLPPLILALGPLPPADVGGLDDRLGPLPPAEVGGLDDGPPALVDVFTVDMGGDASMVPSPPSVACGTVAFVGGVVPPPTAASSRPVVSYRPSVAPGTVVRLASVVAPIVAGLAVEAGAVDPGIGV